MYTGGYHSTRNGDYLTSNGRSAMNGIVNQQMGISPLETLTEVKIFFNN